MLRIALALLSALLVAPLAAGCSSTVRGVIRDKPTGNPIASATVMVGRTETATTDGLGVYRLKFSLEDNSVLVVNASGYYLYSASLAVGPGEDDDSLVRDVELVPRAPIGPAPR